MGQEISCVISGSFTKAKAEIDRARECFEDFGIKVLSPDRGRLFFPERGIRWSIGAYPLLSERNITEVIAKQRHHQAILKSDFLFICAPEGYVGIHVALEMGFAFGCYKSTYSDQPIDPKLFEDTPWGSEMLKLVEVKPPEEVAGIWQRMQQVRSRLWLPPRYVLEC